MVQASAYMNENGISIADYLFLLHDQEDNIIRYNTIKNPVATTWLISFAQILQCNRLTAEYLSFMSEELGVQVMETRAKVLGEKHLDPLMSMSNLVSAYRN